MCYQRWDAFKRPVKSHLLSCLRENVLTINQKHHNSITSASLEDTRAPRTIPDITSNPACSLWTDPPYLLPNLVASKPCLKWQGLESKNMTFETIWDNFSNYSYWEKKEQSCRCLTLGYSKSTKPFHGLPFLSWSNNLDTPERWSQPCKNLPAGHISLGIDIVPLHCHTWHLIHSFRCSF